MSTPHTCPYCELVFTFHSEVIDHVEHDHPEHEQQLLSAQSEEGR